MSAHNNTVQQFRDNDCAHLFRIIRERAKSRSEAHYLIVTEMMLAPHWPETEADCVRLANEWLDLYGT